MTANGSDGAALWDESRLLGQLFMMGFDSTTINDQVRVLIEKYHVGSIMLTAKNLESAEQATQLVLDLQTLARDAGHENPLLIAIDQENGGVNSLYDEAYIRQFPGAMGMAATGSKQLVKYIARATAQELASCGVNWILGPVMDVLTNAKSQPLGVRSYGDNPQDVSAFVGECLKGYQEGGLATCGKHFPSYGNLEFFGAPTDVPTITETLDSLKQSALVPFRSAISQGVDGIMVGGVALSSSDMTVMHACLSEQVIQDTLRNELHFGGVVVSECLEMEALSKNIGISGGTVMAFNAGCDVMLTCRTLSVQEEAINGLQAGLDNGMIDRARMVQSLARVANLKRGYTSWEKAFAPAGVAHLSRLQSLHSSFSTTAYNRSITIVRDQAKNLPLTKSLRSDQEILLLTPLIKPLPASRAYHPGRDKLASPGLDINGNFDMEASAMTGERVFREFGKSLAHQRNGKVSHASYTHNGLRPMHENLLGRCSAVVVVTADAGRNKYQRGFAKHVSALCKLAVGPDGCPRQLSCVVVAVSSPFDFATDLSIDTYVCTYDFTETALQALVRVLCGETTPSGVLPGTASQVRRNSQARQQWLVEKFSEERDAQSLGVLIQSVANEEKADTLPLQNATASTFLLRNSGIHEAHFVVRNSTTKELFGFCATYFVKSSKTGYIGAIIVDPSRRRLSIGYSLHNRAIKALAKEKSLIEYKLGAPLPNVFPGVPKLDANEYDRLCQWFSKLGWDMTMTQQILSMAVPDTTLWSPPDGLGIVLSNPDIKYDLVNGSDHAEAILNHVQQNAHAQTVWIYEVALASKAGYEVIRATRASDGGILGTILAVRKGLGLAPQFPEVSSNTFAVAALSSPVVGTMAVEKTIILQGMVLVGTRQFRRQGIQKIVIDHIVDDFQMVEIQVLGYGIQHSFEAISSHPVSWAVTTAAT